MFFKQLKRSSPLSSVARFSLRPSDYYKQSWQRHSVISSDYNVASARFPSAKSFETAAFPLPDEAGRCISVDRSNILDILRVCCSNCVGIDARLVHVRTRGSGAMHHSVYDCAEVQLLHDNVCFTEVRRGGKQEAKLSLG